MKKVAGRLRLDLAQYRALEAFAQFGSELDKASQQQLARGARVVEVLKQPQYDPVPQERQVVYVYVATGGYLDELAAEDARRFVVELTDYVETRHPEILQTLREGMLPDETEEALKVAIEAFRPTFVPSGDCVVRTGATPSIRNVPDSRQDGVPGSTHTRTVTFARSSAGTVHVYCFAPP